MKDHNANLSPDAAPSEWQRIKDKQSIVLVEVGYCADTRAEDKQKQKEEQHKELVTTLTSLGFNVLFNKDTHCIPLGHGAVVYKSLQKLMSSLEVSKGPTQRLARKLIRNAAVHAHAILTTRRQLERDVTQNAGTQNRWANHKKRKGGRVG